MPYRHHQTAATVRAYEYSAVGSDRQIPATDAAAVIVLDRHYCFGFSIALLNPGVATFASKWYENDYDLQPWLHFQIV